MRDAISISSPLIHGILPLGIAYGLLSPNPMETIWAAWVLWLVLRLFWWQQTPGVFLYVLIAPFIESHGLILEANNYGLTLNDVYPETGYTTFWLSSVGFLAVALGFHRGIRSNQNELLVGPPLINSVTIRDARAPNS